MNFNSINRTSLINAYYTDRPSYQTTHQPQKTNNNQPIHLNPSKSKVNIRQSLNKTTEYSTNYGTVKQNCIIPHPHLTQSQARTDSNQEDRYFKSQKQMQKRSVQRQQQFLRTSHVTPLDVFVQSSDAGFKDNQLRGLKKQLSTLMNRISNNEEQIQKLKNKVEKDGRIKNIQIDLHQYRKQLFQFFKSSTKSFTDFQSQLQKQQNQFLQIKDKYLSKMQRDDIIRHVNTLQSKTKQLYQGFKIKQQYNGKNLNNQLLISQINMKKIINDQIIVLKSQIQKNKLQIVNFCSKFSKNENIEISKVSNKKASSFISFEEKQTISLRDEYLKDRTKQYLNNDLTPRKEHAIDNILKKQKKQYTIRQKMFYIDPQGYLLDENKYYLLNSKNQQILLNQNMINILKNQGILNTPSLRCSNIRQ